MWVSKQARAEPGTSCPRFRTISPQLILPAPSRISAGASVALRDTANSLAHASAREDLSFGSGDPHADGCVVGGDERVGGGSLTITEVHADSTKDAAAKTCTVAQCAARSACLMHT